MPEKLDLAPDYWRKRTDEVRKSAELVGDNLQPRPCWTSRLNTARWQSVLSGGYGAALDR